MRETEDVAAVAAGGKGAFPPLLKEFQFWTIALFAFSLTFHVVARLAFHAHQHMVYPYSMNAHDRFYDFTIFTEKFKLFHTAEFFNVGFPINYPAPVCVLFEVFFKFLRPHELVFFVVFSVLSFAIPAVLFSRFLARRGIAPAQAALFTAVITLLSWPVALIIDGGNAEVFVWIALLIAMWAYATGREWLAAIFFGIGASMKLFPIVFLGLFLRRNRMKYLLAGIVSFFVVSIAGLAILGPTIGAAYRGISYGLTNFKHDYMAMWHTGENGVDHSMFASYKAVAVFVFHHGAFNFMKELQVYLVLTSIVGLLLFVFRIRKMPVLNQVLSLSLASIYFTAFSGDGTLIHLYYPLAMLFVLAIKAWSDGVTIPGLRFILACMVFVVSTESFLVVTRHGAVYRFIGPAHCIGMGLMFIGSLLYPLGPPLEQDDSERVLSEPTTSWVLPHAG